MLVHLIRHGETDWNAIRRVQGQMESHLSERGRQQARQLRERLKDYAIHRVFCSSSVRTRETADILFRESPAKITSHDSLREIYLGPWEGELYDELEKRDPEQFHNFWNDPSSFDQPGAETFRQLQERGVSALQEIFVHSQSGEVAVVSHGALIKAILCHYEGRHLSRLWEPPKMVNCAHSILQLDTPEHGKIIRYAGVEYHDGAEPGQDAATTAPGGD